MSKYITAAVDFGDLKNAALYFDHVIPVCLAVEFVQKAQFEALLREIRDLLPPSLLQRPGFPERLAEVNGATYRVFSKLLIQRLDLPPRIPGLSASEYEAVEIASASEYFRFLDEYGLADLPLVSVDGPASAAMLDDPSSPFSAVVTLANMKVVDASSASWEQIFEFRRDPEARAKLRRLRLFAYEKYPERSRAYVEDDLLTRLADYEDAARQLGLESVQGALSIVLNSKLTAGILAGSMLSTLFGQPVTALAAAAVGAAVEVGHVAVELSKQRFALRRLMRDNPVSFVSYARKRLPAADAR
jgi:hypothetical protein